MANQADNKQLVDENALKELQAEYNLNQIDAALQEIKKIGENPTGEPSETTKALKEAAKLPKEPLPNEIVLRVPMRGRRPLWPAGLLQHVLGKFDEDKQFTNEKGFRGVGILHTWISLQAPDKSRCDLAFFQHTVKYNPETGDLQFIGPNTQRVDDEPQEEAVLNAWKALTIVATAPVELAQRAWSEFRELHDPEGKLPEEAPPQLFGGFTGRGATGRWD